MLTNVNRSVAALLCVLVLVIGGCSESEAGELASPVSDQGEATTTIQPEDQSKAAPVAEPELALPAESVQTALVNAAVTKPGPTSQPNLGETRNSASRQTSAGQLTVSGDSEELIVKAEPVSLDLGEIGTGQVAKGVIRLINTGDKPMTVLNCKANCGCTTTNCPRNKELQPGESVEVKVEMKGGAIGGRRQSKRVDFVIEGQPILRVPVSVAVVAYVEIAPKIIDLTETSDGRVVIRSLDEQEFKIVGVDPSWIEGFDDEARLEHVVYLPMEKLLEESRARRIEFKLDHPQADKASVTVRKPRSAITTPGANPRIATKPPPAVVEDILVKAARAGDVEAITKAVTEGKNLELLDSGGATLLGIAARSKQAEVVRVLLEAGAELEALDRKGRTPLMAAVQTHESSAEVVEALVAKGANVNTRGSIIGGTPLSWAAGPFRNPEITAALLAANADVNTTDNRGMTPLMWAAAYGAPATVKVLLDAGADATAKNKQGKTSLDIARQKGSDADAMETIKILEAKSATSEAAGDAAGS